MLTSHSFFPKITLPTRLSNKHDTLIDLCKLTENTLDTTNGILINKFSDHQPYFTVLNSIQHKNNVPKYIKITKKDDDLILNFHVEILYSLEHVNLNPDYTSDLNINYCIIQNTKAKICLIKLSN